MNDSTKILIIDDDQLVSKVTRQVLEPAGYEVFEATNGEDGLLLARLHSPDLILMNVNMPGMNGMETCRRIKAQPETATAFVLMIAGSNDHIIPASLNKTNCEKYKGTSSTADYREFPGRTHYLIRQRGWEEIADYVAGWLSQHVV